MIITLIFTLKTLFISKSKLFWRIDVQGTNKLHLSFNFLLFLMSVSCWRSAGELAFVSLLFRLPTSKQIPSCSWLVIDLVAAFDWAKYLGKKCAAGRSIVNEAIKTVLSQFIFFLRKIFERTKTHRQPKPTNKNEKKRTKNSKGNNFLLTKTSKRGKFCVLWCFLCAQKIFVKKITGLKLSW